MWLILSLGAMGQGSGQIQKLFRRRRRRRRPPPRHAVKGMWSKACGLQIIRASSDYLQAKASAAGPPSSGTVILVV